MSLVQLSSLCAHMQNATRTRHAITSIPLTKLHLSLCLGLYREGFISGIQRGSTDGPDQVWTPITFDNISSRRLWIGLKYYNQQSVIGAMSMISKPSKKIHMDVEGLRLLAAGKDYNYVPAIDPGECIFLRTNKTNVLEARQAIAQGKGGELLCRVAGL